MFSPSLVLIVIGHDLSLPGPPDQLASLDAFTWLALPIAFVGMGALLITRVPGNAVGWLLLAFTTILATSMALEIYVAIAADPCLERPRRRGSTICSGPRQWP